MHIISHSLIGKAYLAVNGWLCKLKQILRFIKHVLHVTRAWKNMTFRLLFACYLRNLASTECRILSSVCPLFLLPEAYCWDLWYPWRWGGEKRWCNAEISLLISNGRHASTRLHDMQDRGHRHVNGYLWAQTKVTSKEKVKIPKWFFLILPIATVLEAVSGCEWGERTSNLLQTVQRSQWGAHACSLPKIKEWRLMMVDEQFPLQRKILKGQVDVRNEETSIYARSEMNNNIVNCRLVLFLMFITWQISLSIFWQGQTTGWTAGLKWSECQVNSKFIPLVFMLLDMLKRLKKKKEEQHLIHHRYAPGIQTSVPNNHAPSIQK